MANFWGATVTHTADIQETRKAGLTNELLRTEDDRTESPTDSGS